jgi:hypothetical protein
MDAKATIAALMKEASSAKSHLSAELNDLRNIVSSLNERVIVLEGDLETERSTPKNMNVTMKQRD